MIFDLCERSTETVLAAANSLRISNCFSVTITNGDRPDICILRESSENTCCGKFADVVQHYFKSEALASEGVVLTIAGTIHHKQSDSNGRSIAAQFRGDVSSERKGSELDNSNSLKLVDSERFPLTTQPELSEDQQALLDAMNLDDIHEGIENGEELTELCMLKLKELEDKHQMRRERAIANGWTQLDARKAFGPAKQVNREQDEYRGDPQFRLTPEESVKVAKSHREMMGWEALLSNERRRQ